MFYTFSQIIIPILIPLFHPLYTLSVAISFEIISFAVSLKLSNPIYKSIRIVKAISMILFNLVMIRLYTLYFLPYSESLK